MATTHHILSAIAQLADLAREHDALQEEFEGFDNDRRTEAEMQRAFIALAQRWAKYQGDHARIIHAMALAQEGVRERVPGYVIAGTDRIV